MASGDTSHAFVHPHDPAMFAAAHHYINNGILLDLARRYTAAEIAERINAGQKAEVVTTAVIRKRLYRSIARVAERERRTAKEIKASIDAARSASQTRVKGRSGADARHDGRSTSISRGTQNVHVQGAMVNLAGNAQQASQDRDDVDVLLMAVEDVGRESLNEEPMDLDEQADDAGLMTPRYDSVLGGASVQDAGELNPMGIDDSSELSEPPSDLDEPSDTDTVIDEEAEAEVLVYRIRELEEKYAALEVHGLFAEKHILVDDNIIVQLSTEYTITEIVDYLNSTGTKKHGLRYEAKDVRKRINEAVGRLAKRRGLGVKKFCKQLDQERVVSGVAAREHVQTQEKRRTGRGGGRK